MGVFGAVSLPRYHSCLARASGGRLKQHAIRMWRGGGPADYNMPTNPCEEVTMKSSRLLFGALCCCLVCESATFAQSKDPAAVAETKKEKEDSKTKSDVKWTSLFDGKKLGEWKITDFGGQGEVNVEDGKIVMNMGSDMTGITWSGKLPKENYEVSLEAMRMEGIDFFCGMTFPVGEAPCSFIVGGWGGVVVGLSSINGEDASQNETNSNMSFKNGKWYKIRVRVEPKRIQCWIDDKRVVDLDTTGKKLSIRPEVELSRPLGVACWQTRAGLRNIKIRELK